MKNRSFRTALLLGMALSAGAFGRELPTSAPPLVGLSDARLERVGDAIQAAVDDGEVAGAVALIVRNGEVAWLEAFGMADREAGRAMQTDDLFRIVSMTKAVTSTAVLILYEEGHFLLDDPVADYLPEFDREMQIVSADGESLVPATRPITIRHLLTHTSGITYGFANDALKPHYEAAAVSDAVGENGITAAENVRRIASAPLLFEPGSAWQYGLSTDVLGRLVEVVSGQPLDEFLTERLFLPLDMYDTHFRVPATKHGRLATVYRHDADGNLERVPDGVQTDRSVVYGIDYPYNDDMRLLSGGGGLTSTVRDYSRFLQMVLNGGSLGGQRILSRKTVELMTTNQTDRLGVSRDYPGRSWSLAFEYEDGPAATGLPGSPGLVRWDGLYNTYYWVDPEEELVALLFTQHYPFGIELRHRFRVLMYQTIDD